MQTTGHKSENNSTNGFIINFKINYALYNQINLISAKRLWVTNCGHLDFCVRNLTTDQIKNFEIPLPPIEIQKQIISEIEGHQKDIAELKKEINKKEQKIQKKIAVVWGVKEEVE